MTENELMVAKEEMLRKIAERLGQGEPPCDSCHPTSVDKGVIKERGTPETITAPVRINAGKGSVL